MELGGSAVPPLNLAQLTPGEGPSRLSRSRDDQAYILQVEICIVKGKRDFPEGSDRIPQIRSQRLELDTREQFRMYI